MTTFNPSTIEAGGKISLTLRDGTKIIDSPVTLRGGSLFCVQDSKRIKDVGNPELSLNIKSVDNYTPPKPAWDQPNVVMIEDCPGGDLWAREPGDPDLWTCVTYENRTISVDTDYLTYNEKTSVWVARQYPSARAYATKVAAP